MSRLQSRKLYRTQSPLLQPHKQLIEASLDYLHVCEELVSYKDKTERQLQKAEVRLFVGAQRLIAAADNFHAAQAAKQVNTQDTPG